MSFSAIHPYHELPKRLFIDASAGTGKTFSIIHLMCQYLLKQASQGEEVHLSKIACLTFTRAVAREMRSRLQEALTTIKKAFEENTKTGWPYVDELIDQPSSKSGCLRVIRQALLDLDRAKISTLHLFADQLILAWKERKGEKKGSDWIGVRRVREWLQDLIEHGEVEQLFSVYEWKAIKKYFRSSSRKAMAWLIETIQSGLDRKKEERLAELLVKTRKACRHFFPTLSREEMLAFFLDTAQAFEGVCDRKGEVKQEVRAYFEACVDLLTSTSDEPLWQIYSSSLTYSTIFASRKKRSKESSFEALAFFSSFEKEIAPLFLQVIDLSYAVVRVGRLLREAFYDYALKRGYKTPDLLLLSFAQLTEDKEFVDFVRSQFQLVIVDEFQDTDPIQWTMLHKMFHEKGAWNGSLYVVGDPKQSIYLFRGADIYSYLAAKKEFLPEECTSLATNYRASPIMVEAINHLFSSQKRPSLFSLPSEADFLHVESLLSSSNMEGQTVPPICFGLFEGAGRRSWPSKQEEEEKILPWLLSLIRKEEERNVSLDQMAILVKDRYQAERVRLFLHEEGIETLLKRGELVTDTPAYRWFKAAISLFLLPKQEERYADLLLSFPTHETLEVAEQIVSSRDLFCLSHFVAAWSQGRRAFAKGRLSGLFRHLLDCPVTLSLTARGWIEKLPDGDTWLLDLEQLLELLERSTHRSSCLEEVFDVLENLESFFEDDLDLLERRSDPKRKAISIITMHSSKGLEFQSVFVLGASVRSALNKEETAEYDAEKIRQLYVAMTRAKERCFLPIPLLAEPYRSTSFSIIETYFSALSAKPIQEQVRGLVEEYPHLFCLHIYEQENSRPEKRTIEAIPRPRAFLASPKGSSLQIETYSMQRKACLPTFHPKEERQSVPHGALLGMTMHQACYRIFRAKTRPTSLFDLLPFCPSFLLSEDQRTAFLEELFGLLHAPLVLEDQLLKPINFPHSNLFVEQPFYMIQQNEGGSTIRSGVFDLLLLLNNKIWIVDWKTNLEAASLPCEALEAYVHEEGYDLQARFYKEAALKSSFGKYDWGGFFFLFSKHASCPHCHGVVPWKA